MDLCSLLWWALIMYIVVQVVRLALADGDLSLMFAERFGKKPETLRGKVVWIMGASSGIGEYLAYELASAGCRLILSARREPELQRIAEKCQSVSGLDSSSVRMIPMDVLKIEEHQKRFDIVLEEFGHVDILVNNAGRSQRGLVEDTEFEVERQIMELNYFACVSLNKIILNHMLSRREGHIVVTSSLAGKMGVPFSASYCATKHALQGWCDSLRGEVARKNVKVTLLCPGPVFSGLQVKAFTPKTGEEYGADTNPHESRMSTGRCARLCAVAMANQLDEAWIVLQPILLAAYLAQYMPTVMTWLMKRLGAKGATAVRHGQNPLSSKSD